MKRRITLSIALVLSVILVALMSSDSRVGAQNQIRIVADTGLITLGSNQVLRVIMKDGSNSITLENYVFRRIEYSQGACTGGICKHTISSQTTSDPITPMPGEAISFSVQGNQIGTDGVRIVVLSNSRNVRANAMIIDEATGQVESLLALLLP
jgi:hypothetical protein